MHAGGEAGQLSVRIQPCGWKRFGREQLAAEQREVFCRDSSAGRQGPVDTGQHLSPCHRSTSCCRILGTDVVRSPCRRTIPTCIHRTANTGPSAQLMPPSTSSDGLAISMLAHGVVVASFRPSCQGLRFTAGMMREIRSDGLTPPSNLSERSQATVRTRRFHFGH